MGPLSTNVIMLRSNDGCYEAYGCPGFKLPDEVWQPVTWMISCDDLQPTDPVGRPSQPPQHANRHEVTGRVTQATDRTGGHKNFTASAT